MMEALFLIAYLWAFWAVYVLIMGIYRAHLSGRLSGLNKFLSIPIVISGYVMDVATNVLIAPIVFLDIPREWLVTDRLKRYKTGSGWRYSVAEYICEHLLDPFDPTGNHC